MRLPNGSIIQPLPERLPPCGWKPLVVDSEGHLGVEQPPPFAPSAVESLPPPPVAQDQAEVQAQTVSKPPTADPATQRGFRCQRCGQEALLEAGTPDEMAQAALAARPPCPNPPPSPQPPSLLHQAASYAKAVAGWLAEGRPVRPPAEINRIFHICQACERYDRLGHRCLKCGCKVNQDEQAWRNKIAMATESCPLGKW